MDFFDRQDHARKRTKFLIVYFALAIIGIALSIYAVLAIGVAAADKTKEKNVVMAPVKDVRWELFAGATLGTLAVVLGASAFKSIQLHGGGRVVAEELGGRLVDQQANDLDERRLLNVVEEMAIASGVPVPDVYVMENEDTVNAFAAGKTTSDAVIGVTQGCMRMLTRDELQAVIAHEFSHILNGDMRLNMRLMALIFGITVLTIIGRVLLRTNSGSRGKGAAPMTLFALSLIVIGFMGVFFGRLIQKAVSRQREFLADASAVQFTRNPMGMTGALKKIGALGSRVEEPHAEEVGHMMIASALSGDRASLFATHPPLAARIRAIDPDWDGTYDDVKMPKTARAEKESSATQAPPPLPGNDFFQAAAVLATGVLDQNLGQLHAEHLKRGRAIIHALPEDWRHAAHDKSGAQAIVFALLMAPDGQERASEIDSLKSLDEETYRETLRLHQAFGDLHSSQKMALTDLAIPSLRHLSPEEYRRFIGLMDQLVQSDGQVDLFEFTLQKIIKRHLDLHFTKARPAKLRYRRMRALRDETEVLLSTLAGLSSDDETEQHEAFAVGANLVSAELGEPITFQSKVSLSRVDEALTRFDAAVPIVKKQLLLAAARAAAHDDKVTSDEAELLRAMADTIGVPIPPFIHSLPKS